MGAAFFVPKKPFIHRERDALADHCGIVAAFCPRGIPFFSRGLAGLSVLQTRGYDGAGFCAQTSTGALFKHKGIGMVREVFSGDVIKQFGSIQARSWVYQVRYGTSGAFVSDNVQPIVMTHKDSGETFVVAHNGQFSQTPGVESVLSDTWQFCKRLSQSPLSTWEQRIVTVLSDMRGAWSLMISTKDALFVARDPWGFRPFVYGHAWDDSIARHIWVAASETSSLDAMGATDHFELLPGTIAKISNTGLSILSRHSGRQHALCIFENIYLHHGAGKAHLPRTGLRAVKRSPTVDDVRRKSGRMLASEAPLTTREVDMVIGVPGTGIEGGMQYARALDIPYFQAITDRAASLVEQRTFMTADVDGIYQKVLDHFTFDTQALAGRSVVLVDDSIVRGNITRGLVYLLKNHYQVRAVHLRILSPAIDKACHLGVNTRTNEELIAARHNGDVEGIRKELGADSLAYLSGAGLKEALTGNPQARGFCMGCMVGHTPPIDRFGSSIRTPKRHKSIHPPGSHIPVPKYLFTPV